jgi:hypothetical protein
MDDPERELFKLLSLYARREVRPHKTVSVLSPSSKTSEGLFPPPTRFVRRRRNASVSLRKEALAPEHHSAEPTSSDSATPDTTSPLCDKEFEYDLAYELLQTHDCTRCDRGGHDAADCHAVTNVNGQFI